MELSQRNFRNKTRFEFEKDSLTYILKSEATTLSFTVMYDEISTDRSDYQTKSTSARNFGILLIIVGIVHVGLQFMQSGSLAGSIWFALCGFLFLVYVVTKTNYSILQTEKYSIMIIKDANHDKIYNEIVSRRKKLLFSKYGEINYDNDPGYEINKFIWLKNQKIISETDLEAIAKKISDYHQRLPNNEMSMNKKEVYVN
jgi:hypothetical protein